MSHDLRITARVEKNPAKIKNEFTIQGDSRLEVLDENNNLLYQGKFRSFTSNFLKLLYGSMVGAGTAKAKDLLNTDVAMNDFPTSLMNLSGSAGLKKFGLVVGTNSTAVSVSDYNISVPSGITLNATAVSASSVGADSISVEISRQISNTSGSMVNLKEAGLICGSEDEVDFNVLIARDLLDLTLENGKKSVWRYTINFNFANDKGGFVKTFADKMFNGVFEEIIASASWTARSGLRCCVYDNKMWVMGGEDSNGRKNDVWYSSDGITWTQATSSAGWSARTAFGCCVYDNKMWVMGGFALNNNYCHDVWYSSDGITWTQATSSAGWTARQLFGCCVYDNKIWVIGGYNYLGGYCHDVWYSSDGITWTQATSSASWTARSGLTCCVYDNKMWVMGGYTGSLSLADVWRSENGITWMQATSSAGWTGGSGFPVLIYDNKMWLIKANQVWNSRNGVNWILALSAGWTTNRRAGLVYQNKMWVIGGIGTNDVYASKKLLTAEIKPGTSNSAFFATATALGAEIADGTGSGELVYGTMPGAGTIEPFVSGNKTKMSIAREFTNNSGADITVREVGLFSGTDMLARLILANPVTIANGQSDVITVDFETEV